MEIDFSSADDKEVYARELAVVSSKKEAVQLVIGSSSASDAQHTRTNLLATYLLRFKKSGLSDASTNTADTESVPLAQFAQAAPSPGYEHLRTIADMRCKCASLPQTVVTNKDLTNYEESQKKHMRAAQELVKVVHVLGSVA